MAYKIDAATINSEGAKGRIEIQWERGRRPIDREREKERKRKKKDNGAI